jgi:hypothetical protein
MTANLHAGVGSTWSPGEKTDGLYLEPTQTMGGSLSVTQTGRPGLAGREAFRGVALRYRELLRRCRMASVSSKRNGCGLYLEPTSKDGWAPLRAHVEKRKF